MENVLSVNFEDSKKHMKSVLDIIDKNLIKSAHDCSKGGLAIAVSEICMTNQIGCNPSHWIKFLVKN